jgi:glutamate synthase domain-containing protein 3
MVEAYLLFVAEDVRRHLARLGLGSVADAVGRVDLLGRRQPCGERADLLELDAVLAPAGPGPSRYADERQHEPDGGQLGERLARDAAVALEETRIVELSYGIGNRDRAVGARLGGSIGRLFGSQPPPGRIRARFEGVAGQSFGAFLAAGVELSLIGEANDYVGKGMGGGRIVVRPPAGDAGNPVLLGNTVLYGATGGELFCAGRAGERFAVRNSAAVAVVEGVGDHACEYMTGGTVVILGEPGRNLGAGMSGGEVYVYDPLDRLTARLNDQLVLSQPAAPGQLAELRRLVERHLRFTGSSRAAELLERWSEVGTAFMRVAPKPEVASLQSAYEGTVVGGR